MYHHGATLSASHDPFTGEFPASVESLLDETLKRIEGRRREQERRMIATVHDYAVRKLESEMRRFDAGSAATAGSEKERQQCKRAATARCEWL